jgi:hypothetical protein
MPSEVPTTVRARPRKARLVCWIVAPLVVIVFSLVATGLRGSTGAGKGVFEAGDQLAMVGLGILGALGILLFTRPRVEADVREVRVRNVLGSYDLPWEVVREVKFNRGAPWVTLDLQDDDVVAVMAVQATDKEYAVTAVRGLRALLAANRAAHAGNSPIQESGAT